jgi:hypothetical protein
MADIVLLTSVDNEHTFRIYGHQLGFLMRITPSLCLYLFQMIFARDLESCPTFNKLKTLLLNGYWCVGSDFDALTCILKHSPVLEKLTLQLVSEVYMSLVDDCCTVEVY